jgi:NTE family protein
MHDNALECNAPVRVIDTGSTHDDPRAPQDGIALCLSGGGYRAMLFHLGALWRLNEFGYLPRLARISSVSGGSITAGVLGLKWRQLAFGDRGSASNFVDEVVAPVRALADITIDEHAILSGVLTPGSVADKLANAYSEHLFGAATLQDLPADPPRIVLNATNVQTGALFRCSRPFIADYRVGLIPHPTVALASAVAASSAFPPVLSPMTLQLDPGMWAAASGNASEDLHVDAFMTNVVLTDGGVYDNLGLETAWKKYRTILVSDGGGKIRAEESPAHDWARHALRVLDLIDNQVRSLRKRQVIASYETRERAGTYWGIRSHVADYSAPNSLPCPEALTTVLADTPTRLQRLDPVLQERIINWGYAICDAAMRKWVNTAFSAPSGFPYPSSAIG